MNESTANVSLLTGTWNSIFNLSVLTLIVDINWRYSIINHYATYGGVSDLLSLHP